MPGKKTMGIWGLSIVMSLMFIFSGNALCDFGDFFIVDYQDPAGDVLLYNDTHNGTTTEMTGLDIKWVTSFEDGDGNVVITIDLKAKDRFINNNNTKYVVRVFTLSDNSTGFNITYSNETAELIKFNETGEWEKYNFISNVSFNEERDDEVMEIEVNISKFLLNVSHFGIDTYSMMIMANATYLDYISQIPGHPEYVDPSVEDIEDLDQNENDDSDDSLKIAPIILAIIFIIGFIIALGIFLLLMVVVIKKLSKKKKE